MSSKPIKPILKERALDLYDEVEMPRTTTRAELMFDHLFGTNDTKNYDNYANRRKPLTTVNNDLSANQRSIELTISDDDSNDSKDGDFEPSAKTSRTRITKTIDKRRNRVKFADNCDKRVNKKTQKKRKPKAYPDCTKEALLEAFENAGLPDYEQISKIPLHVTKIKDYVKPDPPTPSMHAVMAPFADLIDWSKVGNTDDINDNIPHKSILKSGSAKQTTASSDWETEVSDEQHSDDVFIDDIQPTQESTVKSVSRKKSTLKNRDKNESKLEFRRESLATAGVGANRIASTPLQRRHNVTIKNVSPIVSMNSPEVSSEQTKTDNTFVAPLPPRSKSRRFNKISVSKEDRPLELDIVEPSISDLKKVTLGQNRSKQLSRTLIEASKPYISVEDSNESSDESQTVVEQTVVNASSSSRTLKSSNKLKSLRNRNTKQKSGSNELSSIFEPNMRSTPLFPSKQKNSKYELVVDRSHFDVSMYKLCQRSNSTSIMEDFPIKTTTIIPVLDSQTASKSRKRTNPLSSAYHMYRKSIASVHSIYNKSCQPFRTVIKTSEINSTFDDINDQTIRSLLKDQNDLKRVFNKSLSTSMFSSSKVVSIDGKQQTLLTAKQKVLIYCEPNEVIDFKFAFEKTVLNKCIKIGEGSYGEVFSSKDSNGRDVVIKIVPLVQNENQTEEDIFSQILPELVISLNFNRLKTGVHSNRAPNFIDMIKATTTRGVFPSKLIQEWDTFDLKRKSENEDPRTYTKEQLYIILHLANGGTDLESYQFKSSIESLSIFIQLALALAAAESAFQFEHRDLHWGNVLISTTSQTQLEYTVKGKEFSLSSNGVFASIIDFSLSRMTDNEFIIFDDLAKYSDLFEGRGDYQFDIYRMMKDKNGNDWQKFVPKTNIFWLHYMLDKSIKSKKYSSNRTKVHRNTIELMKSIYNKILDFDSATDLIHSEDFAQYLSHLN